MKKSAFVNIPTSLAKEFGLEKGTSVLISKSGQVIVIKPTDLKMSKKDLKVNIDDDAPDTIPDADPHVIDVRDIDDPDFNPLDRLEIK